MENKQATLELGTKPVGKLLIQYALPAMIAMTAASLYNIVDRVFICQGGNSLFYRLHNLQFFIISELVSGQAH